MWQPQRGRCSCRSDLPPSYNRLCTDPPAATSLEEAIAAIRLVADEEETCRNQPDLTVKVSRAALAFLKQSAEIEAAFKDWTAIRCEPTPDTDAACDARYARYHALQEKIIHLKPVTARDLAIQTYVDSDGWESDHSEDFENLIREFAGEPVEAKP